MYCMYLAESVCIDVTNNFCCRKYKQIHTIQTNTDIIHTPILPKYIKNTYKISQLLCVYMCMYMHVYACIMSVCLYFMHPKAWSDVHVVCACICMYLYVSGDCHCSPVVVCAQLGYIEHDVLHLGAPPFWGHPRHPPIHVGETLSVPPRRIKTVLPHSLIVSPHLFIPLHCWTRNYQLELTQDPHCREENTLNMVLQHLHMEPFAMWQLHITRPSQCPGIDKPHPASIAGTRPAVAGRARKNVAQEVWHCPGVADGYDWQFAQDTLYLYNVQDRVRIVELEPTDSNLPAL